VARLVFRSSARQVAYRGLLLFGLGFGLITGIVYASSTASTFHQTDGFLSVYGSTWPVTLLGLLGALFLVGSRYLIVIADEHTLVLRKPLSLFSRTRTWPLSLLAGVALKTAKGYRYFRVQYRNGEGCNITVDGLTHEALATFAAFLRTHAILTTGF
jgi:hypothetical protein